MKKPKTKCYNILPASQHTRETGNFFNFLTRPEGGGEGAVIQTLRKGGERSKKIFLALRASVWSKITGSATVLYLSKHES